MKKKKAMTRLEEIINCSHALYWDKKYLSMDSLEEFVTGALEYSPVECIAMHPNTFELVMLLITSEENAEESTELNIKRVIENVELFEDMQEACMYIKPDYVVQ